MTFASKVVLRRPIMSISFRVCVVSATLDERDLEVVCLARDRRETYSTCVYGNH